MHLKPQVLLIVFGIWQVTLLLAVCVGLLLLRSGAPVPTTGAPELPPAPGTQATPATLPDNQTLVAFQDTMHDLRRERDELSNTVLRLSLQQTLDRAIRNAEHAPKTIRPRASEHAGYETITSVSSSRAFLPHESFGRLASDQPAQHLEGLREELRKEWRENRDWETLENALVEGFREHLVPEVAWSRGSNGMNLPRISSSRTRSGAGLGRGSETLDQLNAMLLLLREIQFNAGRADLGRNGKSPIRADVSGAEESAHRLIKSLLLLRLLHTMAPVDSDSTMATRE